MISSSFRKIETDNLNPDPLILNFLVLGTTLPAIGYLNSRSRYEIEAATRGFS